MTFIIDAHQDLAYNILTFSRDYTLSAAETRRREMGTPVIERAGGQCLLGWPEYQRGQVALIGATLFLSPENRKAGDWDIVSYKNAAEAYEGHLKQIDLYRRLCDEHPDQFMQVADRKSLARCLSPWEQEPAEYPERTHPVGLLLLLEGAEGLRDLDELEELWHAGVRIIGPVWSGGRFCGGTNEPGGFTSQGRALLEAMADIGFILDIAHMNDESALEALDRYEGHVIASHANARALLKDPPNQRHLSDRTLRRLVERDGVVGLIPFNGFLKIGWKIGDNRSEVTLDTLAAHVDHVCQLAGSVDHVAIGTDFDGGFGWPAVPEEMDTIADLPKLGSVLAARGYHAEQVAAIFGGNWRRLLERALPEA